MKFPIIGSQAVSGTQKSYNIWDEKEIYIYKDSFWDSADLEKLSVTVFDWIKENHTISCNKIIGLNQIYSYLRYGIKGYSNINAKECIINPSDFLLLPYLSNFRKHLDRIEIGKVWMIYPILNQPENIKIDIKVLAYTDMKNRSIIKYSVINEVKNETFYFLLYENIKEYDQNLEKAFTNWLTSIFIEDKSLTQSSQELILNIWWNSFIFVIKNSIVIKEDERSIFMLDMNNEKVDLKKNFVWLE